MKLTRKRSAGNPHAAFDVAGAGNVLKIQWRASSRPYHIVTLLLHNCLCKHASNK